ncbi:MAG: VCBS repeat-containing protein [Acidobacteriota bacterium]
MLMRRLMLFFTITLMLIQGVNSGRAAIKEVYPILDLKSVNAGCLMGAVQDGKLLAAEAAKALLKGGERYRIYGLTGLTGEATGKKPASVGEPCVDTFEVVLSPAPTGSGAIAIAGSWNALPRTPKLTSTTDAVYREAIGEILKQKGITNPKINLTQVIRIDLEGDGVEEVLINATNFRAGQLDANSQAGDYSLVLLRKLVEGKVVTVPINEEYHIKAGEFDAPNEYSVVAVLDVDGDGVMEIAVHSRYYEGEATILYRIEGTKTRELLSCGCGA